MKNFWNDGFSMSETKKSITVLVFFITSIFTLVMYYLDRDISGNLLTLNLSLLGAIATVNVTDRVRNAIKDVKLGNKD